MNSRWSSLLLIVALPVAALAQTNPQSAGAVTRPALDDLLKLVPDDVALVAVVRDLADFVGGIQAFGATIGVDDLIETDSAAILADLDVGDLPAAWRDRIDPHGPLVLAQREPDDEPLLLATITEPADVPTGELVELRGRILIAAPEAEALHAVKSASGRFAQRFQESAAATLKTHDVVVFLNAPAWATKMEQMLSLGQMLAQMGAATTTQQAQSNLALVNWLFQTLRTAYEQTETLVLGARVNAEGLHFSQLTRFERSGRIAEYLSKIRKPDKDLLRGLAAERGMMVMGSEWTLPPDVETFSEHLLEVMLAAAPEKPADDAEWEKTVQQAKMLYRRIPGYNGVMSAGADQPGMIMHGLYFTDNPQALFDSFPALWKVSTPLMSTMAPGFSMEMTDEVETISSVKVRVCHFKFDADAEEMRRMLKSIYGESPTFYMAPHPEGMAFAMGPADVARQRIEKLLTREGSRLSDDPHVASALKRLSPKPQAFVLLDLPRVMTWGLEISGVPAPPIPQAALGKEPVPYMSLGLYLHEASCTAELFVPAKTIKVLVDFVQGPAGDTTGSKSY